MAGTTELASLTTGGALQLTITSPQAGDRWTGGSRTISWNLTGGVGARFAVQYSSDGGTSWLPLTADLQARSLTVDTSRLQGSDRVRFRVLAGAGMSTASAEVGNITLTQSPRVQVAGGAFDLHNAQVDQGVDRKLVIANAGDGPLRISALTTSSAQFQIISPVAPTLIMVGASTTITVRFVPAAAGTISGTLRVDSNDATQPSLTIPVTGKGFNTATSELVVSPAALDFGSVQQGKGQTRALVVTNFGPAPLNVTQVQLAGAGFALAAASPAPFTLTVGQSLNLTLRYVPAATGAATGSISFTSNDPAQASLKVNLNGTGTAAGGAALPGINANGVVNAASFLPGLSRGGLATVFGTNMANGSQLVTNATWPVTMSGAKVLVAGIEAPLYYVSAAQINFQTPFEVPMGTVQVVVMRMASRACPSTRARRRRWIRLLSTWTGSWCRPRIRRLRASTCLPSSRESAASPATRRRVM